MVLKTAQGISVDTVKQFESPDTKICSAAYGSKMKEKFLRFVHLNMLRHVHHGQNLPLFFHFGTELYEGYGF